MYIVSIINNGIETPIHNAERKLSSGTVVKGINSIDTFSFTILPSNIGFNRLFDFKTLVKVYNTNKDRYEFFGRVLCSNPEMTDKGLIYKTVTCESYFGFLCDSIQAYYDAQNWTVEGLFRHIIDCHNSQVEDYKKFVIGEFTVTDDNDNVYIGIQRKKTWETLKEKLLDTLGGEFRLRVVDGVNYIDYVTEIGERKSTKIALSKNMKSIAKEADPSAFVTRLIPQGCKLKETRNTTDEEGNTTTEEVETEKRLDITSVNGGLEYIDVEDAIDAYGIIVDTQEWDDVTEPMNLLNKGRAWLEENNKVQIKYQITALDLSLLGLDIDDFDICNYHPIENALLGIDDTARIISKSIDICEEVKSTIQIGDNFKTLSELQQEQANGLHNLENTVTKIESNYVTNQILTSEKLYLTSLINQAVDSILLQVSETYFTQKGADTLEQALTSALTVTAKNITAEFTQQITETDNYSTTNFEKLYKYIKFSGETAISIGSGDSAVVLEIDNEKGIKFKRNGVAFGEWDGNNFYTGNIVIRLDEKAQFGNFAFVPRSDGSLSFLKVGG